MSALLQAKGRALIQSEALDGEAALSIDDPCVPSAVRVHGACYGNPACWVIGTEPGGYVLYAANGELLDFYALR